MTTMIIKLDSLKKVKEFVDITGNYASKVEVSDGKFTANGKSLMGVCSLDLKHYLSLSIESEDNFPMLIQELEQYIVV